MGFTLIELLVVVTIIVILVALLAPALDGAIYQAQLVVCGSKQSAVTRGMTGYAMDYRRSYPYRRMIYDDPNDEGYNGSVTANQLSPGAWEYNDVAASRNYIPVLRSFLDVNAMLNDPFSRSIDIAGSEGTSLLIAPYALGAGWRWSGYGDSERALNKLGDRFTWSTPRKTYAFDLLIWDFNDSASAYNWVMASHPDDAGLMSTEYYYQDEPSPWLPSAGGVSLQYLTASWIENSTSEKRGLLDRNFGHADGSVLRITHERMLDERMIEAPVFSNPQGRDGEWPQRRTFLPGG